MKVEITLQHIMETITIDKKILFDLISYVAMVAADASTGVDFTGRKRLPEHFAFLQADQLPADLALHVEAVLSNYISQFLDQPDVVKKAKTVMNHVNQAWLHYRRMESRIAFDCIMKASSDIPAAISAIHEYVDILHDLSVEDAENRAGDL